MATLRIDLQSGFDNDSVEIWVDEELRWSANAATNLSSNVAASVPFEVSEGPVDVRIVLAGKSLEERVEALVAEDTWLAVRFEGGRLVVEQLTEAPLYL